MVNKVDLAHHDNSALPLYAAQAEANSRLASALRTDNPVVLVAPTGAGKTHMAADIASKYRRVIFVAHRREIVAHAKSIMPKHVKCMTIHAAVTRGPKSTDLLIIDEAHRSMAPMYRELAHKYRKVTRLGLTATPLRLDSQGLGAVFDEILEYSSVRGLIDTDMLVPWRALEPSEEAVAELKSLRAKLAKMKKRAGDYRQEELSAAMNIPRLVSHVVREYRKHATGKKTIVFAVSIDHSKKLRDEFLKAGIRAAHLDGTVSDKTRSAILSDLSQGRIDVLCNVNLFTEGWDCPAVSCVILARPTASLTLYLQSVGRGLRTFPGKRELLILDHAGNIERHGAPDAAHEWSLESAAEKTKRLAEVAELERIFALGFESLEAYELASKAESNRKCSPSEAMRLVGYMGNREEFHLWAAIHGINPHGHGRHAYYLREEINAVISGIESSWTAKEAVQYFGGRHRTTLELLTKSGVRVLFPNSKRHRRFVKADVVLCKSRRTSKESSEWAAAELRQQLSCSVGMLAHLTKGIERIGAGPASRYRKSDVAGLIESHNRKREKHAG